MLNIFNNFWVRLLVILFVILLVMWLFGMSVTFGGLTVHSRVGGFSLGAFTFGGA